MMFRRMFLVIIPLISFTQCRALERLRTSWQQSTANKCLITTGCATGAGAIWSYLQYRPNPLAKIFAVTSTLSFVLLYYNSCKIKTELSHITKTSGNVYITPYLAPDTTSSQLMGQYNNLYVKPSETNTYVPVLSKYGNSKMVQVTAVRHTADENLTHSAPYLGFPYKCFPVKYLPLSIFIDRKPGDILYFKDQSQDQQLDIQLHINAKASVNANDSHNKGKTYQEIMQQHLFDK